MNEAFVEHKAHFSKIYSTNEWGGSGNGSYPENTNEYRNILINFIKQHNIKTVYDFGCGDWQFSKLIDWSNIQYTGIDCVQTLIDSHNEKYKKENITFLCLDNAKDFYTYKGDLLILKDVLQHWRNSEITEFLNVIKNNFKFILITNSSQQTYDWQDEPDRSRPLSCKYYPLKQYDIEKISTINNSAGIKEVSVIASNEYLNIITGNRFKNICDDYIDEFKPFLDLSQKPTTIFLFTDWVHVFEEKVLPKINYPFKLITHNADTKVSENCINILENKNLLKWFGMNCHINHPKLQPIPIGIANEKWPHGNKQELLDVINTDIPKNKLCYSNFNQNTNPIQRSNIFNIIRNKTFIDKASPSLPFKEYLTELKSYKYVVSPPGNGVDCHRIWEAINLGVIPIVKKHIALDYYKDLPILFVDDFNEITEELLENAYPSLTIKSREKSQFTFYKNLIIND